MPIDWSGYESITTSVGGQLLAGAYYKAVMSYKTADQANIAHNLASFMTQWNNQYSDRFEILEIYGPPEYRDGQIRIYGQARCERGGESFKSLNFQSYWSAAKWEVMRSGKWAGRQGIEGAKYYAVYNLVLIKPGVPGNEPQTPLPPQPGDPPAPGETPRPGAPAPRAGGMPAWGWIGIALGVAVVLFMLLKRK